MSRLGGVGEPELDASDEAEGDDGFSIPLTYVIISLTVFGFGLFFLISSSTATYFIFFSATTSTTTSTTTSSTSTTSTTSTSSTSTTTTLLQTTTTSTSTTSSSTTSTTICGRDFEKPCDRENDPCDRGYTLNSDEVCAPIYCGESINSGRTGCGSWALNAEGNWCLI